MLICLMPQAACDSINAEGGNEQENDYLWRRWVNDAACQNVAAETAPAGLLSDVVTECQRPWACHLYPGGGARQAGATIAYLSGVKRATLDGSIMQALLAPDGTER